MLTIHRKFKIEMYSNKLWI